MGCASGKEKEAKRRDVASVSEYPDNQYDPEDPNSLPSAVRICHSTLPFHKSAALHGPELTEVRAEIGQFYVPIQKAYMQTPAGQRIAFQVDVPGSVTRRGWLIDYLAGQNHTVVAPVSHADAKKMDTQEYKTLTSAISEVASLPPPVGSYEGPPVKGFDPDAVRVVRTDLALREAPEYPGTKLGETALSTGYHVTVGSEFRPLEHQEFIYEGSALHTVDLQGVQNLVLHFYRVETQIEGQDVQGWLLDYAPKDAEYRLEISYFDPV